MADTVAAIAGVLRHSRFRYRDERQLQDALANQLATYLTNYLPGGAAQQRRSIRREVRLSGTERIDLLIGDTVGVEVKTKGSVAAVTAQLNRYAALGVLEALVLITTRRQHAAISIDGPLTVVVLPWH